MPVGSDKIYALTAHGRSYRLMPGAGLGAGIAPSKVARAMMRNRPYEAPLLEHIYGMRLPEGSVAVDAGANVGNHTLWFAAICRLEVHAFEPIVFEQLVENAALNSHVWQRIHTYRYALSDETDASLTHVGKGRLTPMDGGSFVTRRLDDFDLRNVSLIKIDVEGMEPHVLRGGLETIRRERPVIFAEEWDDDPRWHNDIAAVLEPEGYRMTRRFTGRLSATPVGKWEHVRR